MSYAWTPWTNYSITSSGTTVQGTSVRVHSIEIHNLATGVNNFVRFYNATAATAGTTTANFMLVVGANAQRDKSLDGGLSFDTALIVDVASSATGASATAGGILLSLALG